MKPNTPANRHGAPRAEPRFASRAGAKLDHALTHFGLDPRDTVCADLGCSTGGFVSCWLLHGASRVFAVDTGYGVLDFNLRRDERVVVMERTNALHAQPPSALTERGGADFVSIDLSWTPQHLALPAALPWLREGGRIVTLVKPHYEASAPLWRGRFAALLHEGTLDHDDARTIADAVLDHAERELALRVIDSCGSPIVGGKSGRNKQRAGNAEFLALIAPLDG